MKYSPSGAGDLSAFKSDSTPVPTGDNGAGLTLLANTTYYIPLGRTDAPMPGETPYVTIHCKWDALLVLTSLNVETTCFPRHKGGVPMGPMDVSDYDATAGNWLTQNPSSAYVPVVGAGVTATAMTVVATGGAVGACEFDLGNLGARRARLKVVVGATGGNFRANANAKSGA